MAQKLNLSPTIISIQNELEPYDSVYAADIVISILKRHPEYGSGNKLSRKLEVVDANLAKKQNVNSWLTNIRNLYDLNKVETLSGRTVIIGLSMLNVELQNQLNSNGFLYALIEELSEPILKLLSNDGLDLFYEMEIIQQRPVNFDSFDEPIKEKGKKNIAVSSDRVGSYADSPENHPNNDKLGRAAYARYLVQRILSVKSNDAFSMHIGGPWGSGKSTLLNFMKVELKKDTNANWVIVDFNAWQNQHINPPWWPLLDLLFQNSKKDLSLPNYLKERFWRIRMGQTHYFFVILLVAVAIFWTLTYANIELFNENGFLKPIKGIISALAGITGLWAGIQSISSILMSRNSKTAESYMNTTTNPMDQISNKFSKLINRISSIEKNGKKSRIAVFIDDMDRCQTSYVVNLLEGIQTLFQNEKIVFIIAADQRWLHACFEDTYAKLKPHVQESGKGLGTLFLEKVFQFVVPMPSIPKNVSKAYWMDLLKSEKTLNNEKILELRKKAKEKVKEINSEKELLDQIEENVSNTFTEKQFLREEAIVRLAAPEISENIENHTLAPFAPLLNPNPRAMKRLVNAYSANRALSTLVHLDIPQKQLALWTIISMRWPNLARHLESNPQDINIIKNNKETISTDSFNHEIDPNIKTLFRDPEVLRLINQNGLQIELNLETIRKCSMLRM